MELLIDKELEEKKKLMAQFGFIDKSKKKKLEESRKKEGEEDDEKYIKSLDPSDAAEYADNEKIELIRLKPKVETDYPNPSNYYRFIYESPNASVEEPYFWLLHHLKVDQGFPGVIKVSDIFTASEMSAIGGTMQYRLAQQQEKASQYLRGVSELVKQLFQIVREIRVLNEKIKYYDDSRKPGDKGRTAEISLKGQWVDLVEGGAKNPASIYGLAQQVGFTILPDLFFRVQAKDAEHVTEEVKKLTGFNEKVKEVLVRKLYQYYTWKEKTERELKTRRSFMLKYLKQHYNTIKLYMNWAKPYLKTVRRLGMGAKNLESAEITAAFETSKIELEFLCYKPAEGDFHPVILVTFNYRTMPQMSFMAEGYQRGPIHIGQVEVVMRSYVWTGKQIENYRKYREAEDLELISTIDETIAEAMDALGDELKEYLELEEKEAGEEKKKKEKKEKKREEETMLEPFTALFGGFKELFSGLIPSLGRESKKEEKTAFEKEKEKESAKSAIGFSLYQTYKNYKKAHGFLSW